MPQPPAVKTAFDVAFWFADTALSSNEYLQPQKLHRLMFLAQAYYSLAFEGRNLMPAVFVADDVGPIEPNVYAAFAKGRPDVDIELFLPEEVEGFLQNIWRRFGHFSVDKLTSLTKDTPACKQARSKGHRAEIDIGAMRRSLLQSTEAPGVNQVVKPKVLRTQSGRPVTVQTWNPKTVDPRVVKAGNPDAAQMGKDAKGSPVVGTSAFRNIVDRGDGTEPRAKETPPSAPLPEEAPGMSARDSIRARQEREK